MDRIVYHSCNVVLEVNVYIEGLAPRREAILSQLPTHLLRTNHDAAVAYVLPFVSAVQHGDERAIAEVARALQAKQDGDAEGSYYDPRGYDPEEWLPRLLCRVGGCRIPVVFGATLCDPGCGLHGHVYGASDET